MMVQHHRHRDFRMNKRQFLGAAALAASTPALARLPVSAARGPALLTVTGAIARTNRGPFDPALDQMMHKQQVRFSAACTFDFAALSRLPSKSIRPTLEYDAKPHALQGPALLDVLEQAGYQGGERASLVLRAVDGYAVTITAAQARAQGFIVATMLDGRPMPLGGLGPLWAVYDANRVPEMAARPLAERFAACPWALYHIEVQA
jgi:hypothetical protein